MGIFHEAYLVRDGQYEAVYRGMPRCGLAQIGTLLPVSFISSFVCVCVEGGSEPGRAERARMNLGEGGVRIKGLACIGKLTAVYLPPILYAQASHGQMRTSRGRMGQTDGGDYPAAGCPAADGGRGDGSHGDKSA